MSKNNVVTIPYCDNIIASYDPRSKSKMRQIYIYEMLAKTNEMFAYSGLPETMSKRELELQQQTCGFTVIFEHNGQIYSTSDASLGGKPDAYNMPTMAVFAIAAWGKSFNLKIHEECVVIPNDALYFGLLPMCQHYAHLLVEAVISLRMTTINTRASFALSATDDNAKKSAELFLEKLERGDMGVIGDSIMEGFRAQPLHATGTPLNIIETIQYIKSNWLTSMGIKSSYNLKREALNSDETSMDDEDLQPMLDNMLACRQLGWAEVNALFGLKVSVDFASIWQRKSIRMDNTPAETVTEDTKPAETVTEDTTPAETVTEDTTPAETVTEDTAPAETITEDTTPADTVTEDITIVINNTTIGGDIDA